MAWYLDEGLAKLREQWKREHPEAIVYTIADSKHSQNPDQSQHAPDRGGSAPGDDKGEVDAADFMPGNGVTNKDLDDLAEDLRRSRDPRILYVIRRDGIFSSTVQPWVWRTYSGKYHGHTHVSVNDKYDANRAEWKLEAELKKHATWVDLVGLQLPTFSIGIDDADFEGSKHVARAQVMANWLDASVADVDVDGVYGPLTARKLQRALKVDRPVETITLPIWKGLYGLA